MSNLRSKLVRLAHANPELRKDLLPLIRSAMEHSSPEALKKYLRDHPNADKSKHTVKQDGGKSDKGKSEGGSSNGGFKSKSVLEGKIRTKEKAMSDALKSLNSTTRPKASKYKKTKSFVTTTFSDAGYRDLSDLFGSDDAKAVNKFLSSMGDSFSHQMENYDEMKKGKDLVLEGLSAVAPSKRQSFQDQWDAFESDFKFVKQSGGASMKGYDALSKEMSDLKEIQKNWKEASTTSLRSKLVRLAHANPELRKDLLPLLK